nr:hypothetical protein [Pandoravirus belohorizontensis]
MCTSDVHAAVKHSGSWRPASIIVRIAASTPTCRASARLRSAASSARPMTTSAWTASARRRDVMLLTSTAASGCITTAWWVQCAQEPTLLGPLFDPMVIMCATWAPLLALVTGVALMPVAMALGPCLGVALLTVIPVGIAQPTIRAMDVKMKPHGRDATWRRCLFDGIFRQ